MTTTHRIFVTGPGLAEEPRAFLQDEGCDVRTGQYGDGPAAIAASLVEFNPHALIVRAGKITRDVIDAAPGLRVICKHGVGTDTIDIAAAAERGIPVAHTADANSHCVAEHGLALLLAMLRRIAAYDARMRQGRFEKKGYEGVEFCCKTLGLVGFGRSARRLAELTVPFGVRTIAYHPSGMAGEQEGSTVKVGSIAELLSSADIVSLHCPLTPETHHMIDEHAIGLMKPGAYLVNTARGGLVDEADLVRALREGRLAGAALDVFESEPLSADSPLLALDSVLLSPHVAGVSDASTRAMGMESAHIVLAVLRGGMPPADALVSPGRVAPSGLS